MNTVLQRFFALVVYVMVGSMLPLTIAAQTGFDDLPDPTADAKQPTGVGDALPVTIDNTPDSIEVEGVQMTFEKPADTQLDLF